MSIPSLLDFRKRLRIRKEKPQLWYFPGQSFGYIQIPKVASRSIREALLNSPGLAAEKETPFPEFEQQYSLHIRQDQIRRKTGSHTVFAFVRDPLARLYSAYVNKIIRPQQQGGKNIFRCHGIRFGMTFTEFVERVCAISDRNIDRHLRSQSWFLCNSQGALIPDFIGHLEHFEEDWKTLCDRIPALGPVPHKNKGSHGQDYLSFYTPGTEKMTRERYAPDFALFGFSER